MQTLFLLAAGHILSVVRNQSIQYFRKHVYLRLRSGQLLRQPRLLLRFRHGSAVAGNAGLYGAARPGTGVSAPAGSCDAQPASRHSSADMHTHKKRFMQIPPLTQDLILRNACRFATAIKGINGRTIRIYHTRAAAPIQDFNGKKLFIGKTKNFKKLKYSSITR